MPTAHGTPILKGVAPSGPSELAWLLDLLVQSAPYAVPALEELESSLLPGIGRLREPVRAQFQHLWADDVSGCPELVLLAHHCGALLEAEPTRLIQWLKRTTNFAAPRLELLTEDPAARDGINRRVARAARDGRLRSSYADLIAEVWDVARPPWDRTGRAVATEASNTWREHLKTRGPIERLVPPRHPLRGLDDETLAGLYAMRPSFVLSPLYFCLSGGHAIDVGEYVHIAVPASELLPIRKVRDAMFVADRLRVLSEPTRVRILIELISAPSGVMELARLLRMSQATISGHVAVLRDAGLIRPRKLGPRSVFVASRKSIEARLEDARESLARWER
jgi:DNA-binding transcriptional ArsR family regulator